MGAKNLVAIASVCLAGSIFSLTMLCDGAYRSENLRKEAEMYGHSYKSYCRLQNLKEDIEENKKYSGLIFLMGISFLGTAGFSCYNLNKSILAG